MGPCSACAFVGIMQTYQTTTFRSYDQRFSIPSIFVWVKISQLANKVTPRLETASEICCQPHQVAQAVGPRSSHGPSLFLFTEAKSAGRAESGSFKLVWSSWCCTEFRICMMPSDRCRCWQKQVSFSHFPTLDPDIINSNLFSLLSPTFTSMTTPSNPRARKLLST